MSFEPVSNVTDPVGIGLKDPSDPISGDVKPEDGKKNRTDGSGQIVAAMASALAPVTNPYGVGQNIVLPAPSMPSYGNPASKAPQTNQKKTDEGKESGGGMTVTAGKKKAKKGEAASNDGSKKPEDGESAKKMQIAEGPAKADEPEKGDSKTVKIAGPTRGEQIHEEIQQKVAADIWEKAQTDPGSALIDAQNAGYDHLASQISGLIMSQNPAF